MFTPTTFPSPPPYPQAYHRALETASGSITKDLEKAIDKMNTFNAWEIDAEAKRLLNAVGIPEKMLGMPVSKVRVGVGCVGKCESVGTNTTMLLSICPCPSTYLPTHLPASLHRYDHDQTVPFCPCCPCFSPAAVRRSAQACGAGCHPARQARPAGS